MKVRLIRTSSLYDMGEQQQYQLETRNGGFLTPWRDAGYMYAKDPEEAWDYLVARLDIRKKEVVKEGNF